MAYHVCWHCQRTFSNLGSLTKHRHENYDSPCARLHDDYIPQPYWRAYSDSSEEDVSPTHHHPSPKPLASSSRGHRGSSKSTSEHSNRTRSSVGSGSPPGPRHVPPNISVSRSDRCSDAEYNDNNTFPFNWEEDGDESGNIDPEDRPPPDDMKSDDSVSHCSSEPPESIPPLSDSEEEEDGAGATQSSDSEEEDGGCEKEIYSEQLEGEPDKEEEQEQHTEEAALDEQVEPFTGDDGNPPDNDTGGNISFDGCYQALYLSRKEHKTKNCRASGGKIQEHEFQMKIGEEYTAGMGLINILNDINAPLSAYQSIVNWAHNSSNLGVFKPELSTIPSREKVYDYAAKRYNMKGLKPITKKLVLPNAHVSLPVTKYDVEAALMSLLTDPYLMQDHKLSFPNPEDPFCPPTKWEEINENTHILGELHSGRWFAKTFYKRCQVLGRDILCPIIIFIDKTFTDNKGRLCQEPVLITLGIFI